MLDTILVWISHYGLGAIFLFAFVQEAGIPIPVPNELVYLFAGFLASTGELNLAALLAIAIAGDFLGTSVMYLIFYRFGRWIFHRHPNLIGPENLKRWRTKLSRRDGLSIYLGRLVPYARAIVSAAAGSLRVSAAVFEPAALAGAITWSGGWVLVGRLAGTAWLDWGNRLQSANLWALIVIILVVLVVVIPRLHYRYKKSNLI